MKLSGWMIAFALPGLYGSRVRLNAPNEPRLEGYETCTNTHRTSRVECRRRTGPVGRALLKLAAAWTNKRWIGALLLSTGCAPLITYLPIADCASIPGEYVPGASPQSYEANFISAQLRDLGEPVLWRTALLPRTTVRLTMSGFKRQTVLVRFDVISSDRIAVTAVRSDVGNLSCPGRFRLPGRWFVDERGRAEISRAEWEELLSLMLAADFDRQPLLPPLPRPDPSGEITVVTDGTDYLWERRDEEGYRAVLRHSSAPFEGAAFEKLCARMFELAPLNDVDRYCEE